MPCTSFDFGATTSDSDSTKTLVVFISIPFIQRRLLAILAPRKLSELSAKRFRIRRKQRSYLKLRREGCLALDAD
jgi:hypothetical protein